MITHSDPQVCAIFQMLEQERDDAIVKAAGFAAAAAALQEQLNAILNQAPSMPPAVVEEPALTEGPVEEAPPAPEPEQEQPPEPAPVEAVVEVVTDASNG